MDTQSFCNYIYIIYCSNLWPMIVGDDYMNHNSHTQIMIKQAVTAFVTLEYMLVYTVIWLYYAMKVMNSWIHRNCNFAIMILAIHNKINESIWLTAALNDQLQLTLLS